MESLWTWLPYLMMLPALGVGVYCIAQMIRDVRRRNIKWAVAGGVCASIMLTLAASFFPYDSAPVETHAVMYEIPQPGRPVVSSMITVIRIAERAAATMYPDFDTMEFPPIVKDNGGAWLVYYKLRDDMIGGTPEIEIDKTTLRVISSTRMQ